MVANLFISSIIVVSFTHQFNSNVSILSSRSSIPLSIFLYKSREVGLQKNALLVV
jgi:hypothetical protein